MDKRSTPQSYMQMDDLQFRTSGFFRQDPNQDDSHEQSDPLQTTRNPLLNGNEIQSNMMYSTPDMNNMNQTDMMQMMQRMQSMQNMNMNGMDMNMGGMNLNGMDFNFNDMMNMMHSMNMNGMDMNMPMNMPMNMNQMNFNMNDMMNQNQMGGNYLNGMMGQNQMGDTSMNGINMHVLGNMGGMSGMGGMGMMNGMRMGLGMGGMSGGAMSDPSSPLLDMPSKSPTTLRFENLTYVVKVKNSEGEDVQRTLLDDVTGVALPNEVLAVVGPSGAGKSTLLDALAGRINARSLQGILKINGRPLVQDTFRRQSGYVMQHDALLGLLTVRETLMYSARLRLPRSMPAQQLEARVAHIISELSLDKIADSLVGGEGSGVRGISGGEMRRVSIGTDMVHDPAVLFLDEPTSGLDSSSALQVVKSLNTMAEQGGRTIVLTIHQPGARVMDMIHKVLVLANGRVVYYGSFDGLESHFAPFAQTHSLAVNPLEMALDTVEDFLKKGILDNLVELYETRKGALFSRVANEKKSLSPGPNHNGDVSIQRLAAHENTTFANDMMTEVLILLERTFKNVQRTKPLFVARIILVCIIGFCVSSVFFDSPQTYEGIRERVSFFVYTIMALSYTSIDALPVFLHERDVFIRETSRGGYRPASYTIATALVYLPFILIQAILFSITCWWMVGFEGDAGHFFFFTLTMWLTLVQANALVMFLSAVAPNFMIANTVYGAVIPLMYLFSGFFVAKDRIPKYWLWLHYISIIKYPFEATLINQFDQDEMYECNPQGTAGAECLLSGDDVLDAYDLKGQSKWVDVVVILGFGVFYRLAFWRALSARAKSTRD